jgi:hypothetical protein
MKKLEEVFNLPSTQIDENIVEEIVEDYEYDYTELSDALEQAQKIDRALGQVKGLELLDKEMDEYSKKAMETFEELMVIGKNVEDRNAAGIFDVAAKMMGNAITASQSKMDRKLKAIHLQLQKMKLDQEQQKIDNKAKERRDRGDDGKIIEGDFEKIEISRDELIRKILQENINKDKEDS